MFNSDGYMVEGTHPTDKKVGSFSNASTAEMIILI